MPLTDPKIRALRASAALYRVADSRGLCIEVRPTGAKMWRFRYRFAGKAKMLTLGEFPAVPLREARVRRDRARDQLQQGIDPSVERRTQRVLRAVSAENTFRAIGDEWFNKHAKRWTPGTIKRARRMLDRDLFPWIGDLPIEDVTAPLLLSALRRIEGRGALETAHRTRSQAGQIFRYAIATGRATVDPSRSLIGALPPHVKQGFASITDPPKVGALLRALWGYSGYFPTICALRLAPLTFVRPGELRQAEWQEVNLDAGEWRIPEIRMKSRRPHVVPLARQAAEILRELQPLTGGGRFLFPGIRDRKRPMSDNTVNAALRRMGYSGDEMTGHGFRSIASTILHEQGWSHEAIERQLAHGERDEVSRAYNFAQHMPERKKMMQAWADYLDGLRSGANVVGIRRSA